MKCLSKCPNSKKTPLLDKFMVTRLYYNGLSMGCSTKKWTYKFFGRVLKNKENENATCVDFQLHNLKFSQKGILDFQVTTTTPDICMKEEIDSSLHRAL